MGNPTNFLCRKKIQAYKNLGNTQRHLLASATVDGGRDTPLLFLLEFVFVSNEI